MRKGLLRWLSPSFRRIDDISFHVGDIKRLIRAEHSRNSDYTTVWDGEIKYANRLYAEMQTFDMVNA
ncbi:hypothetical protein RsTz2092_08000 [Deferribacterales bacterium RsTz2092]|nr:hypothetical protein AGMMS49941_10520 [Deferribacterales bacterium]